MKIKLNRVGVFSLGIVVALVAIWATWDQWKAILPDRWLLPSKMRQALGSKCVECHVRKTEAVVNDWRSGRHAYEGVDCYKCHRATSDRSVDREHLQYDARPISMVVSPLACGSCHRRQLEQFAASKHANTLEIIAALDPWLKEGLAGPVEITTGCSACHGSRVAVINGKPDSSTWPNVGIGRLNPDGSRGSCSACHTRHRFAKAEARKPEACNQCHLGPDHPQMEIYAESKHGAIYKVEGDQWRWDPKEHEGWLAGRDFRAPTCAACHISGGKDFEPNHDVGRRLSWELQAPVTLRPENFTPWPSKTGWKTARANMERVCLQCHGRTWVERHFENLDAVVRSYERDYYSPLKKLVDGLYSSAQLDRKSSLDEEIELEFYEFWHHAGRRARMGVAMSAPDYAWWHGFYPLKKAYRRIFNMAAEPAANTMVWRKRSLPAAGP